MKKQSTYWLCLFPPYRLNWFVVIVIEFAKDWMSCWVHIYKQLSQQTMMHITKSSWFVGMGDRSVTCNGPATLNMGTISRHCCDHAPVFFVSSLSSVSSSTFLALTVTVIISEQQKNDGRYRNRRYIRAQCPQYSQYFLPLTIQLPCLSISRNTAHVNNCTMNLWCTGNFFST